ncbi:hypothetical protein DOY81_008076, partial [Sarcophaga bullata]
RYLLGINIQNSVRNKFYN